jgi:hypothetical protein
MKFKIFSPHHVSVYDYERLGKRSHDAATSLNNWLAENPNVEILSWQTATGKDDELYITIQYKEKDDE